MLWHRYGWIATHNESRLRVFAATPVISSVIPKNPPLQSSGVKCIRNAKLSMLAILIVISTHAHSAFSCKLGGMDIGVCDTSLETDKEARLSVMPFCGQRILYSPCVPRYDPLPPSRDYPEGRWFNNTIKAKDDWIRQYHEEVIAERIKIEEESDTFVPRRFSNNADCRDSFRDYLCYSNFPRYDEDGNSMPLCRSVCKNMMKSCEFPKDIWRCGESQFFNGYEPEKPTWVNGIATYLRDYFPGQPFVENQYTGGRRNKQPLPVCSPSLEGKGSKVRPSRFILCVALVIGYCLSYLVA